MNVEAALVQYLNGTGVVQAFTDVPADRPAQFVTVERTGGALSSVVRDQVSLAVQVWGGTRYEASELALTVRDTITRSVFNIPGFARVRVEGLYNFPDPDSKQARYQLTVEVIARADY
ncbi:hypothetical protein [Mycetocola reblochoni]|uniref:hypothetical protein n=1 Tax=Mycetocola reblochoni TaxID=331618 RepID=UPI0015C5C07F|nr:hypothetical protein [Mycetocola reblochoni]